MLCGCCILAQGGRTLWGQSCNREPLVRAFTYEGQVAPKPIGGDQRSHWIEFHAGLILTLYEAQPGIYLHELPAALAERGVCVSQSSLSRFFTCHGISRKRAWGTRANRTARTWRPHARLGSRVNSTSPRIASCSSTKPQPTPPWLCATGTLYGANAAG